jgi:hypothetical protein
LVHFFYLLNWDRDFSSARPYWGITASSNFLSITGLNPTKARNFEIINFHLLVWPTRDIVTAFCTFFYAKSHRTPWEQINHLDL